jgi:hypothetical protein
MPLASILIVRDFYAMNLVQGSKDIPKPPQNRTLWTIVIPLRTKTVGYVISAADAFRRIADGEQRPCVRNGYSCQTYEVLKLELEVWTAKPQSSDLTSLGRDLTFTFTP